VNGRSRERSAQPAALTLDWADISFERPASGFDLNDTYPLKFNLTGVSKKDLPMMTPAFTDAGKTFTLSDGELTDSARVGLTDWSSP
jgi:hypothetical protein